MNFLKEKNRIDFGSNQLNTKAPVKEPLHMPPGDEERRGAQVGAF